MNETVMLETKGLEQLLKAVKGSPPTARVGILGGKTNRRGSKDSKGVTNAEIGASHEYGTTHLPQRSFLRVPIAEHLEKKMKESGAFGKKEMAQVIKQGSVIPWLKKVAVLAEGIVAEAFDTGGFGKWEPSDMTHKKNHQTLVETQQLRNAITSEVKK